MIAEKQKTIIKETSIVGVGLHTGNKVKVVFKPAPQDSGINFIRTDLPQKPVIKVCPENLLGPARSPRRTSLGAGDVEIQTIEHLLAALYGLSIDNIVIEINNNELPGMDGSALRYLEVLSSCGIRQEEKERHSYVLHEPVVIEEEGASIMAMPAKEFKVSYTLNYNHPLLKGQFLELNLADSSIFKNELAGARTFCLENEAQGLKQQGLGTGANYENTLVVGQNGVIKNKLRYEDEFVRHKIVDLLGDLYILGQPIKAHITALRSGHSLNLKLVNKISQQAKRALSAGIGAGYHPKEGEPLDIEAIMRILPHREPFLFVDRIISMEQGKRAVGIKNVTINDYFFRGHFPQKPVMPGVLIVEAMAQVGGVMMLSPQENRGKLAYFMAADNVKFRKTVVPGDQLVMEVEAGRIKARTGQVHAKAFVDGKIVAEADLMFALA